MDSARIIAHRNEMGYPNTKDGFRQAAKSLGRIMSAAKKRKRILNASPIGCTHFGGTDGPSPAVRLPYKD